MGGESLWAEGKVLAVAPLSQPLKVLATLPPIQALAAGVMKGRGAPALLLEGTASPHTYFLRPRDLRRLEEAQVIFWIGPGMESFLAKTLGSSSKKALSTKAISLMTTPGLELLAHRKRGALTHGQGFSSSQGRTAKNLSADPHIWLSPENAVRMVQFMAEVLSEKDPEGRDLYHQNAQRVSEKIKKLQRELALELAGLDQRPFLVFHDGYQYFEKAFGLKNQGVLTVHPEFQPSPRMIGHVIEESRRHPHLCLFGEAQFPQKLLHFFRDKARVKVGILDPIGVKSSQSQGQENPDEEAYLTLLRTLGKNFKACLKKPLPPA